MMMEGFEGNRLMDENRKEKWAKGEMGCTVLDYTGKKGGEGRMRGMIESTYVQATRS